MLCEKQVKPGQLILKYVARALKVPPLAVDMLRIANRASGLDKKTLPTELIPLNSIQLSRGLLNFTILQAARDWVLPFWAEQQFDASSPSFLPRSHLGLSINVTNRNWTAIGNPDCAIEPIVDPTGLVTPFRNGWSIDVWLTVSNTPFFPSRTGNVHQQLFDNLPIVRTEFEVSGIRLILTSFTHRNHLTHHAEIVNTTNEQSSCVACLAVRPFNPEGISPIHELRYDSSSLRFHINNHSSLHLAVAPDGVECSNFELGDCSLHVPIQRAGDRSVHCEKGMAHGAAAYTLQLGPNESRRLECGVELNGDHPNVQLPATIESVSRQWSDLLGRGTTMETPDGHVNALITASLSTLLMLTDGSDITPGPHTYHQFWFRDAAYMLSALDKFGFASFSRPIVQTFPDRQDQSGFFRSQQGEWDSNGQALWTIWQHALHSHDKFILESSFDSLQRGVQWIHRTRLVNDSLRARPFFGLLPAGLSAEHLGLVDHYFWDNAWSIAGIETFINACKLLGKERERVAAEQLVKEYRADVERAILMVQEQHHTGAIPASPNRGIDCGMIGSTCFWYPLQILPADDPRMLVTLEILLKRFRVQGMFFQDFVHSGMNPYLTLHLAQTALYCGKREVFVDLVNAVFSRATSTLTFPEAIHPATGGGTMGDGHHGWACAEILHAMRDAFIQERWTIGGSFHSLVLCAGLPAAWLRSSQSSFIRNAVIPEGTMTLLIESRSRETTVTIDVVRNGICASRGWSLQLPLLARKIFVGGAEDTTHHRVGDETHISLAPQSGVIRIIHE